MPGNAHKPFRNKRAAFIVTNLRLWTSRREGEGPGEEKEGGRKGKRGQRTEEKDEGLRKMLKSQREDRKLAGKRWERLEGGGKAIAEEKCLWSGPIQVLCWVPLAGKVGQAWARWSVYKGSCCHLLWEGEGFLQPPERGAFYPFLLPLFSGKVFLCAVTPPPPRLVQRAGWGELATKRGG